MAYYGKSALWLCSGNLLRDLILFSMSHVILQNVGIPDGNAPMSWIVSKLNMCVCVFRKSFIDSVDFGKFLLPRGLMPSQNILLFVHQSTVHVEVTQTCSMAWPLTIIIFIGSKKQLKPSRFLYIFVFVPSGSEQLYLISITRPDTLKPYGTSIVLITKVLLDLPFTTDEV